MIRRFAAPSLLLLCSCTDLRPGLSGGAALEPPTYAVLSRAQNERVDRLSRVAARGSIELRWSDENGRHFVPGDIDLWFELPHQTAMNIEKFGERFIWLGSNASGSWMFDFRNGETVVYLVDADDGVSGMGGRVPIQPATVLTLCGLTRLPEPAGGEPPIGHDPQLDAWVVDVPGARVPTRLFLDRTSLLPVRAEILDAEGRVLLYSRLRLRRYERVHIRGTAVGTGPQFPTLSDLRATDEQGVQIKLSLPSPADDRIEPQFFDLDWLIEAFEPDRVEGGDADLVRVAAPR